MSIPYQLSLSDMLSVPYPFGAGRPVRRCILCVSSWLGVKPTTTPVRLLWIGKGSSNIGCGFDAEMDFSIHILLIVRALQREIRWWEPQSNKKKEESTWPFYRFLSTADLYFSACFLVRTVFF
jgi:hypothetical protein